MMYCETLSTASPCTVLLQISFTYYGPYKFDTFKTACIHLLHTFITFFFSIVPAETMDWGTWYIHNCMNCNTKFIHGNFTQIFFINVHYINSSVIIVSGIQAGWPRNQCWLPQRTDTNFFCIDHGAYWASYPLSIEGETHGDWVWN